MKIVADDVFEFMVTSVVQTLTREFLTGELCSIEEELRFRSELLSN